MSASRIARKPVSIPSGVEVKIQDKKVSVKGPKGHLDMDLHPYISITMDNNQIQVKPSKNGHVITGSQVKLYRSIAGTVRANLQNIVQGVTKGFERRLALVGVGYRAQAKGKTLSLSLGFSHPTDFPVPAGITIETPSQTEVVIKGIDKNLVGLVAAKIRNIRSPEPYKGKGVRYANEIIELKETKKK